MAENTKPIFDEIATTADGKDITRGYVDPLEIAQPADSVLQSRGSGDYKIYSEVLRDDQVISCFGQRRLAVLSKDWNVEAGGKSRADKSAAAYLKEQLENVRWDNSTGMMLYGIHYGFAVAEGMYARDGSTIALDDIKVRDRRRFGFDSTGRLRMRTQANPKGELMPDRKFWAFSTGADHDDNPYGVGLAHWLYWPTFFKRNGLKYWLLFLEKFGQPTAKGEYGPSAKREEINRLLQALAAISTDTGIAVPEGMKIELLEAARSGTADYVALYDRMDAAIAKVILGQTASTQGTPGKLGNDELQGDVRTDLIAADADLICESFNRGLGRWLTEWNFPNAVPPRVYRNVQPDEDSAKRAQRDKNIFDMGFKPTLQYVQENYGDGWEEQPRLDNALPAADKPADTPLPTAAAPGVESVQQTALNGAQIKSLSDVIAQVQSGELDRNRAKALIEAGFPAIMPEQIERLLGGNVSFAEFAEMLAPADAPVPQQMLEQARATLEPATNAWINQIREMANSATDMEDLRDKLLTAYPDMSLDQYAQALATASTAANLAGRDDVKPGAN